MMKTSKKAKERHKSVAQQLRLQLRKKSVKRLNQTIKRKNIQVQKLQEKLSLTAENSYSPSVHELRKELSVVKRKHRRLKAYDKIKTECLLCTTADEELAQMADKVKSRDATIRMLENENIELEDMVDKLKTTGSADTKICQKEGNMFTTETRMFVYDALINHVPNTSIPKLLQQFAKRTGLHLDSVPTRNSVEMMARELGVISDFEVAEVLLENQNFTLGFDATTQEVVHVNGIHVTSADKCYVIAIDALAGGTAEDYENHITTSIHRVAEVYATFHDTDFEPCREKIVKNITNTMTDRVAVNHATISRLEETWNKHLNELNCHLHPLETISSSCRSVLKGLEIEKGKLYGH